MTTKETGIWIGVRTTTQDGYVTITDPSGDTLVDLHWSTALTAVRALIQASGTASAIGGVSRDDYVAAMLAELGDVGGTP